VIPYQDYTPEWYREGQPICTSASVPYQSLYNFATRGADGTLLWQPGQVSEETGIWTAHVKDMSGCFNCLQPPQSSPTPPALVPRLKFRRTYTISERAAYEQLNVVPPEYEIILK
jgi:hypothetical protein